MRKSRGGGGIRQLPWRQPHNPYAPLEVLEAGQVVCITPFTLAGAMAPVTLAGTLTQQNAEALAGITLCQVVRPGAPVVYGAFTSNVDMKTGSPAFGTPEYAKAAQASGQLARRYGLPMRSSNVTSSNVVDAQSTYESSMSLWAAVTGHANIIVHAAGWLEGGLTASFEKLIVDAEMLQMMSEYLRPIEPSRWAPSPKPALADTSSAWNTPCRVMKQLSTSPS